ncbi:MULTISPECIES: replication initiation protein [Larkinella]|uniref:Replication initiation protein n=1 Tax=Larkinella punicea TaxID=2315727 RepID=A0A368JIG4_9BACT|nr:MULTISPECIES: replication initiation protein [Larkinella]RCR67085.1 replication initiation protein [Larkinella punicea]
MDQEPSDSLAFTQPTFIKYSTNYQSNLFTESRQEFTELEKNIVTLVVNQLGNMAVKGKIEPRVNVLIQIPIQQLTKSRYDQVVKAAESLSKKRMSFRDDKKGDFTFITPFPLVQSGIGADGLKVIEITMLANVVPYFAELGQRYTQYENEVMLSLASVYAKRMFEIVSMYFHRGQYRFRYAVDELRRMLNCPETYRYNDFVLNALVVSQKELHEKANIALDWNPSQKSGKKVLELEFTVKTDRQLAEQGVEQDRQALRGMSIHEAVQLAWPLLAKYKLTRWQKDLITSEFELLDTFYRIHSELTNGLRPGVKNPTAYLVKSLGIDQVKPDKATSAPELTFTQTPAENKRFGGVQTLASIINGDLFKQ